MNGEMDAIEIEAWPHALDRLPELAFYDDNIIREVVAGDDTDAWDAAYHAVEAASPGVYDDGPPWQPRPGGLAVECGSMGNDRLTDIVAVLARTVVRLQRRLDELEGRIDGGAA